MQLLLPILLPALCSGTIQVLDWENLRNVSQDDADNAVLPNYQTVLNAPLNAGILAIPAVNTLTQPQSVYQTSVAINEPGVALVSVTRGAIVNISQSALGKEGAGTNLAEMEGYGVNSAIVVTNASSASLSFCNVTTHNGAIGMFAYGQAATVYVTQSTCYTSGPVAHAAFASAGGSVIADRLIAFTGGYMSSALGAGALGTTTASNCLLHTIGENSSPLLHTSGDGANLISYRTLGNADNSPIIISYGSTYMYTEDNIMTGGGIAGIIVSGPGPTPSTPTLTFVNTWHYNSGQEAAAMWFGNVFARLSIYKSTFNTESGLLVTANNSRLSSDYTTFETVYANTSMTPAQVQIDIQQSSLQGDIFCLGGATVTWIPRAYSKWTGGVYVVTNNLFTSHVNVLITKDSQWFVTRNSTLDAFYDEDQTLSNIIGLGGYSVMYNKSNPLCGWLNQKTVQIQGGGWVVPY